MALGREYRLRRKKDFQLLQEKGQFVRGHFFHLLFLVGKEKRIGIIVSRKIASRAVDRNRLRRRLAEIARLSLSRFQPAKIIILARKAALTANFSELQNEWQNLLREAKLWH